jgi:hypothetical protein
VSDPAGVRPRKRCGFSSATVGTPEDKLDGYRDADPLPRLWTRTHDDRLHSRARALGQSRSEGSGDRYIVSRRRRCRNCQVDALEEFQGYWRFRAEVVDAVMGEGLADSISIGE